MTEADFEFRISNFECSARPPEQSIVPLVCHRDRGASRAPTRDPGGGGTFKRPKVEGHNVVIWGGREFKIENSKLRIFLRQRVPQH